MEQVLRTGLLLASLSATVAAQGHRTTMIQTLPESTSRASDASPPGASVTWGFDIASDYFFRGMRRRRSGPLGQPHLEISYDLLENKGPLHDLDLVFGTWNSLHDGRVGTQWDESNFYLGVAAGFAEGWTASTSYVSYASPNGAFSTVREILFTASYDDFMDWGDGFSGLKPTFAIGREMKGQGDLHSGSTAANHRGTYGQVGIEPSLELGRTGELDWTLSLPTIVGFSLGDYYEHPVTGTDRPFGFLDVGAIASTELPFVPSRFGPWTMSVSLHVLILGSTPEAQNNGNAAQLIASIGFTTQL